MCKIDSYYFNKVLGFTARLKLFPADFKVVELDKSGKCCYQKISSSIASAVRPNTNTPISPTVEVTRKALEPCSKKFLNSCNSSFSIETKQFPVFLSKNQSIPNEIASSTTVNLDKKSCEVKLNELLSPVNVLFLQEFKLEDDKNSSFESYSVGHFESKEVRTSIHNCIRYLYPHFCTITNISEIKVQLCPKYQYFSKLIGRSTADSFIRFACIFTKETQQTSFTITGEYTKDKRRLIHRGIDNYFGKLLMSKTLSNGQKIEVRRKPHKRQLRDSNQYCKFVMYKSNLETLDAIQQIANKLHSKPYHFSYAGTKDKRAETWQWMTVKEKSLAELKIAATKLPSNLGMSDITETSLAVCLGDLAGNQFHVTLRNVSQPEKKTDNCGSEDLDSELAIERLKNTIEKSLDAFQLNGFVNYFGPQRFGRKCSGRVLLLLDEIKSGDGTNQSDYYEASAVGRFILKQDWKSAVDILLYPSELAASDVEQKTLRHDEKAKLYLYQTGDIEGTIKRFRSNNVREISILRALRKFTSNVKDFGTCALDLERSSELVIAEAYRKALLSLPHNILVFYVHAYCSLIWNKAATERLRNFKHSVMEGDLVMADGESKATVVSASDVQERIYNFNDVVLPSPGNSVIFPPLMKEFYFNILKSDGILQDDESLKFFRINQLRLYVPGSYRKLVEFPRNLNFSWSTGSSCDGSNLARSSFPKLHDSDRMTSSSDVNLHLSFELRPACYATTFLQQLSNNVLIEKKVE